MNVNLQIRQYNHLKGIRTDSKGYDKKRLAVVKQIAKIAR